MQASSNKTVSNFSSFANDTSLIQANQTKAIGQNTTKPAAPKGNLELAAVENQMTQLGKMQEIALKLQDLRRKRDEEK